MYTSNIITKIKQISKADKYHSKNYYFPIFFFQKIENLIRTYTDRYNGYVCCGRQE